MLLTVTTSEHDGWSTVTPQGEIDISSAPQLDEAFDGVLEGGAERVAVDLRGVTFMDSTGLRSLILAHRRLADADGTLAVVPGTGPVRRVLEVAGVLDSLVVVASVDDLPSA